MGQGWRGMEKWRKETVAEAASHLLHHFFAQDFSSISGLQTQMSKEARIVIDGVKLASRD